MSSSDDLEISRWLEQLDVTISEVFTEMLGISCLPSVSPSKGGEQFKVVLHVTGEIERTFCLYFDEAAAKAAVYAFTQDESTDWEHHVEDAVGEIGNMVIGTLKRKLLNSSIPSSLSIPIVSREKRKEIIGAPGESRRDYQFLDHTLEIRLDFRPSPEGARSPI